MSDLDDFLKQLDNKPVEEWVTWDIDKIIAVQRKARADFELGIKPQKDKPKADLSKLKEILAPKSQGTFRR